MRRAGIVSMFVAALILVGCATTPTPPDAAGWWDTLSADQRVASFYGDEATDEDREAASPAYGDLDGPIRDRVHATAENLYGNPDEWPAPGDALDGSIAVIGSWWNSLHCDQMRIAAGDGIVNTHESPFCRLYFAPADRPDAPLLQPPERAVVNEVGSALLVLERPDK